MIVPTLQRGNAAWTLQRQLKEKTHGQKPYKPHFLTGTVVEWLPVFTRADVVQILLDCGSSERQQRVAAVRSCDRGETTCTSWFSPGWTSA